MADNVNIFDKYGIKEVANVYFEALETDEKAGVEQGDIIQFLDILKASTRGESNYVFYDGPIYANAKPGIHHVLAKTIKS